MQGSQLCFNISIMRKVILVVCSLLVWFFQVSFSVDTDLMPPVKKIGKAINKIWKTSEFEIINQEITNCVGIGCWYKIVSDERVLGLVYNGRVNSCRSGGCSIDPDGEAIIFEYFDYLLFTDNSGKVLWVKIYNYQATQGYEVMSRGWLNQFKGLLPDKNLEFGSDIEAISGATVSAVAVTTDIQKVLSCAF